MDHLVNKLHYNEPPLLGLIVISKINGLIASEYALSLYSAHAKYFLVKNKKFKNYNEAMAFCHQFGCVDQLWNFNYIEL